MSEKYEVEIRRYEGTKHKVLDLQVFDDWTEARRFMRHYNDLRKNTRTEACGPWPTVTKKQK